MKCNVGPADRVVRIILGVAVLAAAVFAVHVVAWKWVLIVVGVLVLLTGLTGRCGLYVPFGINTCKAK